MKIREDRDLAIRKLTPLNERLARQYGVSLDLATDVDHLRYILEHYTAKREVILAQKGETAGMQDPDYAKAVLISETVRLFLREIAPKRSRKKKR
jgi:hypothetical protein